VHTGDLGVMESDGYIRIVGRLKDMIIRGGENIFPREVEDALVDHPDILEAAVFGIRDDRWGEQVVAAVRLAPGASFDEGLAKEFLLERIGRHKIPKLWMVVDTLPYVGLGKVQKFLLRERFLASRDPSNPTGE
jgi:fatty-acyl-CoA synthase